MSPGEGSRDTREKNTNRHALQPASLDPRPARRVYGRPRSVRRLPWARACRLVPRALPQLLRPLPDVLRVHAQQVHVCQLMPKPVNVEG
ncbi:unnamed protein product [Mycena citricolor]|uniref:Uncharacterized protein n=1 Tax=Mycena citricolor TaxID=2018698 RepID=A0AAD2HUJ5_9AGAR|nr:unnamed protein product [Mycena citricolor]